jgi:hypothetical protein
MQPTYLHDGYGSITVSDALVNLYQTSDYSGKIKTFSLSGQTFLLTDNAKNYLVGRYNSGSPDLYLTNDVEIINESNIVPIVSFFRDGYDIHNLEWDSIGLGMVNRLHQRCVKTERFAWESGVALGEEATRIITITSGILWYGAYRSTSPAARSDTNSTELWYYDGANWQKSTITQYNNTQYYNTSTHLLTTVSNNNYCVNWIYKDVQASHIIVILGTGDYSLAQAQGSRIPALVPPICTTTMILVGRIIVEESQNTATQIDTSFVAQFQTNTSDTHNDLAGLQGGTTSDYYHLKQVEHNWLTNSYTAGYWSPTQGGTGLTTLTTGDILYASATNTLSKLPISTDGYVLTIDGGIPSWEIHTNTLTQVAVGKDGYVTPATDGYLTVKFAEVETEVFPAYVANTTCYIKNLTVTMSDVIAAGQTVDITIRKNNADTVLTLTLDDATPLNSAATLRIEQNTTNIVSLVNGDKVTVKYVASGTADAKDVFITFDILKTV